MRGCLIGRTLREALEILTSQKREYEIRETRGLKDRERLKEPYVIAVREGDPVVLVVSYFCTKVNGQ